MTSQATNSAKENVTSFVKRRSSRRKSWRIAQDLPSSLRYASQGIFYSFSSQRNFRIHVCLGSIALLFGIFLGLDTSNLAILVVTISAVLVLELINTSIEAVVDLAIGRRFHPLARIAKDCAAGAVLVASIGSLLVAIFVLLPPLLIHLGISFH